MSQPWIATSLPRRNTCRRCMSHLSELLRAESQAGYQELLPPKTAAVVAGTVDEKQHSSWGSCRHMEVLHHQLIFQEQRSAATAWRSMEAIPLRRRDAGNLGLVQCKNIPAPLHTPRSVDHNPAETILLAKGLPLLNSSSSAHPQEIEKHLRWQPSCLYELKLIPCFFLLNEDRPLPLLQGNSRRMRSSSPASPENWQRTNQQVPVSEDPSIASTARLWQHWRLLLRSARAVRERWNAAPCAAERNRARQKPAPQSPESGPWAQEAGWAMPKESFLAGLVVKLNRNTREMAQFPIHWTCSQQCWTTRLRILAKANASKGWNQPWLKGMHPPRQQMLWRQQLWRNSRVLEKEVTSPRAQWVPTGRNEKSQRLCSKESSICTQKLMCPARTLHAPRSQFAVQTHWAMFGSCRMEGGIGWPPKLQRNERPSHPTPLRWRPEIAHAPPQRYFPPPVAPVAAVLAHARSVTTGRQRLKWPMLQRSSVELHQEIANDPKHQCSIHVARYHGKLADWNSPQPLCRELLKGEWQLQAISDHPTATQKHSLTPWRPKRFPSVTTRVLRNCLKWTWFSRWQSIDAGLSLELFFVCNIPQKEAVLSEWLQQLLILIVSIRLFWMLHLVKMVLCSA